MTGRRFAVRFAGVVLGGLVGLGASAMAQQAKDMGPMGVTTPPSDPRIVFLGRVDRTDPNAPRFGYPGTGWTVRFQGPSLTVAVEADSGNSALTLVLDGKQLPVAILEKGYNRVPVAVPATTWDSSAVSHTLEVLKRTETWQGLITFRGLGLGTSTLLSAPRLPERKLMFLGDSVTCGVGGEQRCDVQQPGDGPFDRRV